MKNNKIEGKLNIGEMQKEVLDFWEETNTFEKSLLNKTKGEKVFYDGPPFPTGNPHHGTILISFVKDMISRYWTMNGYSVPRKWGWDCHGLPIETQAEKILGLSLKTDIENKVGVAKFNETCYNIVSANNDNWAHYINQMARWVDYDNSYKTMDTNFMESVIWSFKQCYDKGLIYKNYRVTPYCYRCETSLSISDTKESDSTRPKQDTWVVAKFATEQKYEGYPIYILAWTTTPWTLPSNMALAVNKDINYSYTLVNNEVFISAHDAIARYPKIFGENFSVLKTVKGCELFDMEYTPLLPYFADKKAEGAFRVISADYVTNDDGMGVVHTAPAFGEDDYWVCKDAGVPLVNPVDEKGIYSADVTDFAGRNVMDANKDVIRFLRDQNLIIDEGSLMHNYPHCWRCRTPLIYKAMDAWYFNVTKIKERLIELNDEIKWIPGNIKEGRFGKWLDNARDWNISRNRYWGTPIPVWECPHCGKHEVLGSIDEIEKRSGIRLTNLHKQYMDAVEFKCECGHTMKRIPEVLDNWYDAGSVPFASKHYPFENKEWFDQHTTSDFVDEGAGQIRCWFYYLLVLSGALFDKAPFKHAIVNGTILAADGKKISKSLKNYTDPMELFEKYGTDAFRLYLYQSNAILLGDLQFNDSGISESLQQILLPLWNACSFYTSYADIDGYTPQYDKPQSNNILDKWLLAKLYETQQAIITNMNNYQLDQYIGHIASLIDGLTNWYIRRSRRRFWGNGLANEKKNAYDTLHYVLVNITKLLAPAAPIITEKLYKALTNDESVHLTEFTELPAEYNDPALLEEIWLVQKTIYLARVIRTKNTVKNRQPLSKLQVAVSAEHNLANIKKYSDVIMEELNVKEIEYIDNVDNIATIVYKPNFLSIKEKYPQDMQLIIKNVKQRNFNIVGNDVVINDADRTFTLSTDDLIVEYIAREGLHVTSENGIVVSLDLTLTDELIKEGIAREIVRNIQDTRKTIGCEITDRIKVELDANCPAEWIEYICKETLSDLSTISTADAICDIESNGKTLKIKIQK